MIWLTKDLKEEKFQHRNNQQKRDKPKKKGLPDSKEDPSKVRCHEFTVVIECDFFSHQYSAPQIQCQERWSTGLSSNQNFEEQTETEGRKMAKA